MELNALHVVVNKLVSMLERDQISVCDYTLLIEQITLFKDYVHAHTKNDKLLWHEFIANRNK